MTLHSIVVAFDGEKPSVAALSEAADMARKLGARLSIVTVVPLTVGGYGVELPPSESPAFAEKEAQSLLDRERSRLESTGLADVRTVLLEGDPVDQVVAYCEREAVDLLVVGSRGLSSAGRFFLGSVSDGILHHAHCSVLVVKSTTGAHH